MHTLRLTQSNLTDNHYRVHLEWEAEGGPRQTATVEFTFAVSAQDQEDIRWYLESYLEFPFDPAPRRAGRVEERMREIGTALFQVVFEGNRDTWQILAEVRQVLGETRIEIATTVQEATSVPWELLHDPLLDMPWSLRAQAFVRVYSQPRQRPKMPRLSQRAEEPIRILLVICRPREREDVPFRSVARRLVDSLAQAERESQQYFQIAVLRPPTFDQLTRVLRKAKDDGQPYHVVHFDGHGAYREVSQKDGALLLSAPRQGKHGYLQFENPATPKNEQLVDGRSLGNLLRETEVPVLILNACRSAHAETPSSAEEKTTPATTVTNSPPPVVASDIHSQVYAFGSLAQELMDAGLAGVVAMRYNVYVVTAAQFVGDLYTALLRGQSLGAAVSVGRKQLHDQPMRGLLTPVALQDWLVPVVFEAAEIKLFPLPKKSLRINLPGLGSTKSDRAEESGVGTFNLPPRPDVGFFGRDETLLALDRAFDRHPIALLYAYAGSGKTTEASEFARWYQQTSGVQKVLFTSFETYKPLLQVLGDFGQFFGEMLQQKGINNWSALALKGRREVALQVLQKVPVLWIWDNVEPVTGFPAGSDSAWSVAEQQELVEFLRAAQSSPTQAKFLLTSRREEQAWLGDLPVRIRVPPLPLRERFQLAKALGEKYGRRHLPLFDWRPLLEFSQGNPLTLTVVVRQALRDQLQTPAQITAFVEQLRAGEAEFSDEQTEQRDKSLGASLSYGFAHAFTEEERQQVAVLYFFQGFVGVNVLRTMGNPKVEWRLPELQNLTRDSAIHLLNRAAEIGLLTAVGSGYYSIHPALPWYFKRLFETYYADNLVATRAFVVAMGGLGDYYCHQYEDGNREVINLLQAEEANLLQARRLAKTYEWWDDLISTMQGLHWLHYHTGRRVEWAQLVAELVPFFIDSQDNPLPGREEQWGLVTEYRVRLAVEQRQWAERLQQRCVAWNRQRAAPFLATPSDSAGRHEIRTLAVSLHQLAEIQRECEQAECVKAYQEALTLAEQIEDNAVAATCAYNLGHAYKNLPPLRNLDQAAQWYQRSLELFREDDRLGRGKCYVELGSVAYARFQEARNSQQPEAVLLRYISKALEYYLQALELYPDNAVNDLAAVHHQLGLIYMNVGDLERTLFHYQESIHYYEMANDFYGAAITRYNIALALANANRLPDALDYAQAALRGFQGFGQGAAKDVERTEGLIGRIEEVMRVG